MNLRLFTCKIAMYCISSSSVLAFAGCYEAGSVGALISWRSVWSRMCLSSANIAESFLQNLHSLRLIRIFNATWAVFSSEGDLNYFSGLTCFNDVPFFVKLYEKVFREPEFSVSRDSNKIVVSNVNIWVDVDLQSSWIFSNPFCLYLRHVRIYNKCLSR